MDFELSTGDRDVVAGFIAAATSTAAGYELPDGNDDRRNDGAVEQQWNDLMASGWMRLPEQYSSVPCLAECMTEFGRGAQVGAIPIVHAWLASVVLAGTDFGGCNSGLSATERSTLPQIDISALENERIVLSPDRLFAPSAYLDPITSGRIPQVGPTMALTLVRVNHDASEYCVVAIPLGGEPLNSRVGFDVEWRWNSVEPQPDRCLHLGHISEVALIRARSIALCLIASSLVGYGKALFDTSLQYLKDRKQFGVPLGSFQVLKHRAVDLYVELHAAELLARAAAGAVDTHPDSMLFAYMARASGSQAAQLVARESIQFHGAMGFTWEAGLHLRLRRAIELGTMAGSTLDSFAAVGRRALQEGDLPWPGDGQTSSSLQLFDDAGV
jgi:hypothetical protein